jgi:hypothetical protein
MARKRAESPLRRRRRRRKNRKKKSYPEVLRGFHQANAEMQNNQATNGSFSACQITYTLNTEKK